MKYFKMFGLVTAAATAMMAFTIASASATTLSNGSETLKSGSAIDASLTGTETAKLEAGSTILDECTGGTAEGVTFGNSGSVIFVNIEPSDLTWSGCTKTTDTEEGGSLSISWTSGSNGSVSGSGFRVKINTIFGPCVYGLGSGTHLGTLVGGTPATLAINTSVTKSTGNIACPATATWTANYTVTKPSTLTVQS